MTVDDRDVALTFVRYSMRSGSLAPIQKNSCTTLCSVSSSRLANQADKGNRPGVRETSSDNCALRPD